MLTIEHQLLLVLLLDVDADRSRGLLLGLPLLPLGPGRQQPVQLVAHQQNAADFLPVHEDLRKDQRNVAEFQEFSSVFLPKTVLI